MSKIFFVPMTESDFVGFVGQNKATDYENDYPEFVKTEIPQKPPNTYNITVTSSGFPEVTDFDLP